MCGKIKNSIIDVDESNRLAYYAYFGFSGEVLGLVSLKLHEGDKWSLYKEARSNTKKRFAIAVNYLDMNDNRHYWRFLNPETWVMRYGETDTYTLEEIALMLQENKGKPMKFPDGTPIPPTYPKIIEEADIPYYKGFMPRRRIYIKAPTREEVYKMFNGHCAYCGKKIKIKDMQVDHIVSHFRHNGTDELENYFPSCKDCNGLKSDYLLEEFRETLIPKCLDKVRIGNTINRSRDCRSLRIVVAYGLDRDPKKKIEFYFEKKEREKERESDDEI